MEVLGSTCPGFSAPVSFCCPVLFSGAEAELPWAHAFHLSFPLEGTGTWQATFNLAEDRSRGTADLCNGRGLGGPRALPRPVPGPRTPSTRGSPSKAAAARPYSRTPCRCENTGHLRATTGTDARGCDFKDASLRPAHVARSRPLGRDGKAACGKHQAPSAAASPATRTRGASVRAGHARHRRARTRPAPVCLGRRGPACGLRASQFLLEPFVTKTSCIV